MLCQLTVLVWTPAAITEWPALAQDIQDLRSFIGLVYYSGRCMENSAKICLTLINLLAKNEPWVWTPAHNQALATLVALTSAPVL